MTLAELEKTELENGIRLRLYKTFQQDYISNLQQGNNDRASEELEKLDEWNTEIMDGLEKENKLISELYPEGSEPQQNVNTTKLTRKIQRDKRKIHEMMRELDTLNAENHSSQLTANSYKLKYFMMFALMAIVVSLVARAFATKESGKAETVIFVVMIVLILYFIFR